MLCGQFCNFCNSCWIWRDRYPIGGYAEPGRSAEFVAREAASLEFM